MNQFFKEIEAALLPTANQYAPQGTDASKMQTFLDGL